MLAELRRRNPIKTAERSDRSVQFINNEQLGRVLTQWMRNSTRPDRELPVHLYGYHQPRQLPGKPKPKEKRERCKLYDLRHAWALRARETTTWSTSLKAQAMGHSEAVHARRYLVEERAEHRRQGLLQLVAHDEGRTSTSPSASGTEAISPEILALARQLAALKG
jgi:integrase